MFGLNRAFDRVAQLVNVDASDRKRRRKPRGKKSPRPRLQRLESLERRELMSVNGDWLSGLLSPPSGSGWSPATEPTAPAAEVRLQDPVGDAYNGCCFADMTGMSVTETSSKLVFRLAFADEAKSLFGGVVENVHASILLDMDGNRQTPVGKDAAEAVITVHVSLFGHAVASYSGPNGNFDLNARAEGNSVYVELPKHLLPANADNLEIAAVSSLDMASGGRDRAPNAGYLRLSTGEVHVDNEGLNLQPLSWLGDPAGDAGRAVDLKGVELGVAGEHLVLRSHFNHPIGPNQLSDVCFGTIDLDLDGDILTGLPCLSEGSHTWPTFGADASLDFTLSPRFLGDHITASLTVVDPQTGDASLVDLSSFWGSHFSDAGFRYQDNWVEFSIPLSVLPPVTDDAVVLTHAMTPWLRDLSEMDYAPNGGGINFVKRTFEPYLVPHAAEFSITDPAGDAFGGESDNGDLVGIRACRYDEGILLEVEYSDLRTTATGMTQILFDLDQDPATGEAVQNMWGHTVMGAETSISYMWDASDQHAHYVGIYNAVGECIGGIPGSGASGITAIQVVGASGDMIRGAETLVDGNFATRRWQITVPYRALGIEEGTGVDVYAATCSTYLCPVPYDEINGGVLSIGGATRNVPPPSYPTLQGFLDRTHTTSAAAHDAVLRQRSGGAGDPEDSFAWLYDVLGSNQSSTRQTTRDNSLARAINDLFARYDW